MGPYEEAAGVVKASGLECTLRPAWLDDRDETADGLAMAAAVAPSPSAQPSRPVFRTFSVPARKKHLAPPPSACFIYRCW